MKQKENRILAKIKKPSTKKQKIDLEFFRCPNCKHVITIENKSTQNGALSCPICGQKNIFKRSLINQENMSLYNYKNLFSQINYNATVIGLLLALTGLFLIFMQTPYAIKLSVTILIIAVIFPLFITEKAQNISMQITFGIIFYIIFLFLLTGVELEIFLVLIFLGVLVTKTVLDEYIPRILKIRMNFFIIVFFIIFIIIITKRIISLLGI
ncbi:MAG: hypothetical protein QHH15_00775 [Candidatus Thermoplasmatota archaeon]|nr:hypothetical protein [Candidatus Thermoplasmatota archaeon]